MCQLIVVKVVVLQSTYAEERNVSNYCFVTFTAVVPRKTAVSCRCFSTCVRVRTPPNRRSAAAVSNDYFCSPTHEHTRRAHVGTPFCFVLSPLLLLFFFPIPSSSSSFLLFSVDRRSPNRTSRPQSTVGFPTSARTLFQR